jgi:hypothetical protein
MHELRLVALTGGLLLGMSALQAEFDFGVAQFRLVFQPLLLMLAAGVVLVAARIWLGRGAAIGAVLFFLVVRGLLALLVGPVLGQTTPHFPLYIVSAAVVELLALAIPAQRRPLAFGAVAGVLVGTVGLAAEWRTPSLRAAGALAATCVGVLSGWALYTPPGPPATVSVTTRDLDDGAERTVAATVRLDPPRAADDAEWLTSTAWQGGGLVVDRLERVRAGVYRTTEPIPVHGNWKSLVRVHRGNALDAVPIFLPDDPAIPAPEVPASASFTRTLVPDSLILQREQKTGVAGALTTVGYSVVAAIALALLALLAWGLHRLAVTSGVPASERATVGTGILVARR